MRPEIIQTNDETLLRLINVSRSQDNLTRSALYASANWVNMASGNGL